MKFLACLLCLVLPLSAYCSWEREKCEYVAIPGITKINTGTCSVDICIGKIECTVGGKLNVQYDVSCAPSNGVCPDVETCIKDKSISIDTPSKKQLLLPTVNSKNTEQKVKME